MLARPKDCKSLAELWSASGRGTGLYSVYASIHACERRLELRFITVYGDSRCKRLTLLVRHVEEDIAMITRKVDDIGGAIVVGRWNPPIQAIAKNQETLGS